MELLPGSKHLLQSSKTIFHLNVLLGSHVNSPKTLNVNNQLELFMSAYLLMLQLSL